MIISLVKYKIIENSLKSIFYLLLFFLEDNSFNCNKYSFFDDNKNK